MTTPEQENAAREQALERSFTVFMAKPETKMLLSLIPPLNPPELLHTLLKGAFEAGFADGYAVIVGRLMMEVLKREDRK